MGEKHCPKWPTATPTIRFPVAVDLGWASRDDSEGTIAEPAYIMYGERLPRGSFLRHFDVTTLVRVYLCMIALLAVKQEQMNTVDLLEN